jgi:hypothetical protein
MRLRSRPFSRPEIAFVVGVPLAWAVLLLFHPAGDSLYDAASSDTTAWLVVHLGSMVFIPLLAAALFVILRHFDGTAAAVGRGALAVFAVVYLAFEILVGVSVGLLIDDAGASQATVTAYGDSTVLMWIETVGSLAWLVAVTATGIAMFDRAHTARSVAVVLLFVISAPGIVFHVSPVGPIGLALFVAALLLVVREPAPVRAEEEPLVAA